MSKAHNLQAQTQSGKRRPMLIKGACVALLLATLGGCASVSTRAPEEVIAERATDRWAGFIKGDLAKAYQYNTPGYRGMVTQQRFQEMRGRDGRVISASVYKVTCEQADKCTVRMQLKAFSPLVTGQRNPKPTEIETYVNETWLLEEGQWWHFEKI